MKLTAEIRELSYTRVVIRVMARMEKSSRLQDTALGKTFAVLSALPEAQTDAFLQAIPEVQKRELLAAFFRDYQEKILSFANAILEKQNMGIVLSSLQVSPELEVTAEAAQIHWPMLTDKFLPVVRQKLLAMGGIPALFGPVIARASAWELCRILDRIPGVTKEALLISLVGRNASALIGAVEALAEKQGIPMKIESIRLTE